MSITIYVPQESGNLKYIAEVDEVERPEMALDALLDEMPRVANQGPNFVALVGTMEDGQVVTLTLDPDAPVEERPKRMITVSANGAVAPEEVAEDDEPAPAKRTTRKRTTAKRGATTGAKRTATKKLDGRTKAGRAAKAKGSPFKTKGDED